MKYKFLEHTADFKFQAYGSTLEKAFENAALAVSAFLTNKKPIKSIIKKRISIETEDKKSLLYEFLDNLIFLLDTESFIISKLKVKISDNSLTAELKGDNASKYDINEIKAATYAEMHIKKNLKGYEIQAVMDI